MKRIARLSSIVLSLTFIVFVNLAAQTAPPPSNENLSPQELRQRDEWRVSMAQVPLPKQGCFQTTYPAREWREVACVAAPNYPMPPKRGPRPLVVGNGDDVAAQAPSGFISTTVGSFDSVTNVTSESSKIGNSGNPVANAYTLQINTNFFSSTVCTGAGDPTVCRGWQQFVYENTGSSGRAFIQYWIIKFNNPCPPGQGWNQFQFTGDPDIYCFKNNTGGAVGVPNQPITNLGQLSLSGQVSNTGDSVTMAVGNTLFARNGDNAVNAAAGWTIAEFNIVGDGGNSNGGSQAAFNNGAQIVTRTRIVYGGTSPPNCVAQGFTAETNNLSFGPSPPVATAPGPAVIFEESTAGGATSNCAAATSVGDTHLDTVHGLFYDFQSSGDFVVAQVDPDFLVEARQVSGAPTWPNASVNHDIAARMGKTTVAVCLNPARLNVNGDNKELGDGTVFSTPDGVDIWRVGSAYIITDQNGNSVKAVVNPTWIDLTVGLGKWPTKVAGLLANANNNVNQLVARDGFVLNAPFQFRDFYQRYGQSWRSGGEGSLLSACSARSVEVGNPAKAFYAKDLDRAVFDRARAVCTAAGVKNDAHLDACTLDVAVIGNNAAANVFVNARPPVAVGTIVGGGGSEFPWWLWLLLLLFLVLFLIWLLLRRKHP